QEEDGIRDRNVTGVQTCALPISSKPFSVKAILKDMYTAKWALFLPVLVLGGIYAGFFTPTEASVVGAVYALIVGSIIYKNIDMKTLKLCLTDSALLSATI